MRPGIPEDHRPQVENPLRPSMRPRPCGPGYEQPGHEQTTSHYPFNEAQAMRPGIRGFSSRMCLSSRILQ